MENPLIFSILKAQKVTKSLKYLSDPHFQNLHVEIYKKVFYLTAISPLFTAVGSGEECAWPQSASTSTVRFRVQHLTPLLQKNFGESGLVSYQSGISKEE